LVDELAHLVAPGLNVLERVADPPRRADGGALLALRHAGAVVAGEAHAAGRSAATVLS
jgi:hypothetical protein